MEPDRISRPASVRIQLEGRPRFETFILHLSARFMSPREGQQSFERLVIPEEPAEIAVPLGRPTPSARSEDHSWGSYFSFGRAGDALLLESRPEKTDLRRWT
jgi:hypothetical protein